MTWVAPDLDRRQRSLEGGSPRPGRPAGRDLGDDGEARRIRPAVAIARKELLAALPEVGHVGGCLVRGDRRQQPALGRGRGEGEAAPLLAAEPDRRAARGQRRRVVGGAVERVERVRAGHAGVGGRRIREQRAHHVDRGFEAVEALGHRRRTGSRTASCSGSNQPAPSPRMNRPPVAWSMTVAALASTLGWRNVADSTACPHGLARDVVEERRHRGQRLPARAGPLAG